MSPLGVALAQILAMPHLLSFIGLVPDLLRGSQAFTFDPEGHPLAEVTQSLSFKQPVNQEVSLLYSSRFLH